MGSRKGRTLTPTDPRIRDLVLGTAGHIDHGKTALVRALTGVDTDRLPAEKQRGITIDLGFAALDLGDARLAVVDVPGHERFIRNMVAGATGLDLALLVVAADDSVMPQTREHLEILRLLGLGGGVIALTKCDLADPAWLGMVRDEIRALVAGTFLADAEIIPTSATAGTGLGELRHALGDVARSARPRADTGYFRMAVDRSFTVAGIGTVVTGTVASGELVPGAELECQPAGRPVRVRSIQRHGRAAEWIGRGARAALNLSGIHHTEIGRGDELASPGYLEASRVMSVEIRSSLEARHPLRHRGRYRLHLGTAEATATLALADGLELGPGDTGFGQFLLSRPLVAVHGEPFVLRQESPPATLGGGRILEPCARRRRRRDADARRHWADLAAGTPEDRIATALASYGLAPLAMPRLSRDTGVAAGPLEKTLAEWQTGGRLVELPIGPRRTIRIAAGHAALLDSRVLKALARLHAAHPRQATIPRTHLMAELPDLGSEALIGGILDRLDQAGKILREARTVALRDFKPKLSHGERALKQELAHSLRDGGFRPPDQADLVAGAGGRAAVVPELLALLVAEQQAVAIGPGFYLDFDAEAELRRRVRGHLAEGATMTMAELRDLLGTSRKYAVPFGEYLDRVGLTTRDGDIRRLAEGELATPKTAGHPAGLS